MISPADILNARILIVDDQAANVMLLEEMLRGAGYTRLTSTRNPREVCTLHRLNRYDLILLDLQMPGFDGFQVMEGLKEIESGGYLPVLVITAQPDHKLRALQAGAKDFVSKPFDLAEVLLRVRNMIEVRLLHLKLTLLNFTRLENSQRIAGLGDWEYNFATHRLVWSEGIYRILGLARPEVAPGAGAFDRVVHPDDLAYVQQKQQDIGHGSGRAEFDHRIIRPDGSMRYLHQITETTVDAEGQPARASGIMQDITDRKFAEAALLKSEERFKFVARAVSDVVWDWDLAGNTYWWNDGFLTNFGFAAGEIAPSVAAWTGRIHPEERSRVMDGIRHAIAAGAETWAGEYRLERKDGSHAFVADRAYILRDAAGKGIRLVGGMRDLTEQKKVEAQYVRAQRMESMGTLAGGIAHDLNNVLAPILLSLELLKRDPTNDPRRVKILNTIYVSCCRGADLVRQVLSFGRKLDGQRVAVRLRPMFDELKGVISGTFPAGIKIVVETPADLWPIQGDPSQLHQVLLNLAVNARDAMPQGGKLTLAAANLTIDAQYAGTSQQSNVGAAQQARSGAYVVLTVTDTGHGIPAEVRDRIFEPFFTTKEVGKGTGLGLATVHTIVKSHGGFINVYSEAGKGSTFKVYLPADPALQAAPEAAARPVELPRGRDELVLVVDDDFSIRDITQQTLEDFGYRVLTACDGAEAVAVYAKHELQIAVVITDMMMPVMDGPATIRVLMRINPAVKVIAASGFTSGENVTKARNAGVLHYLPKPYTAEALLKLLRVVIDEPVASAVP
ncbi:MAG: response regulator [Lacunisphaera sp.]|nr:response regulator [Lacunisphaera sp.]